MRCESKSDLYRLHLVGGDGRQAILEWDRDPGAVFVLRVKPDRYFEFGGARATEAPLPEYVDRCFLWQGTTEDGGILYVESAAKGEEV